MLLLFFNLHFLIKIIIIASHLIVRRVGWLHTNIVIYTKRLLIFDMGNAQDWGKLDFSGKTDRLFLHGHSVNSCLASRLLLRFLY